MPLELDGPYILFQIAKTPQLFGLTETNINALANLTLINAIKDKKNGIDTIRSIKRAAGGQNFDLVIDGMHDKEVSALVKKLDPRNSEMKNLEPKLQRQRICALADGVEPVAVVSRARATPAPRVTKPKLPKTGEVMKSKALKARKPG